MATTGSITPKTRETRSLVYFHTPSLARSHSVNRIASGSGIESVSTNREKWSFALNVQNRPVPILQRA